MNISINFYIINTLDFYKKNNTNVNICSYAFLIDNLWI